MVIWLIGISGSGKTTLGKKLHDYFLSKHIPSFIIDGDLVRNFFDNDLSYSKEDRVSNIKRILLAASILEQNNIIPIVCNISPFEHLRDFARSKLNDYHEIYLKKNINVAKKTDIKGMYKDNIDKTKIVGFDMDFENPQKCNLILNIDDETEEISFKNIIKYIQNTKHLNKGWFK